MRTSVGSVAAHAAVSPLLHLASAPPAPARPSMSFRHSRADRVQLGLGLICFCAFLTEGALADWSAVWLHDKAHASEAMAALGYAAFAGAMTTMRMVGDRLLEFFGSVRLLRTLIALGTLALAGALALARVDTAMIAFVLLGLGMATVVLVLLVAVIVGLVPLLNTGGGPGNARAGTLRPSGPG